VTLEEWLTGQMIQPFEGFIISMSMTVLSESKNAAMNVVCVFSLFSFFSRTYGIAVDTEVMPQQRFAPN